MNTAALLVISSACLAMYLLTVQNEADTLAGGLLDTVDSALTSLDSAFMSLDASLLDYSNVRAFLALIRYGESSNESGAYSMLYGGGHFAGYNDHPKQFFTLADGRRTSAAGAYQITWTTWQGLVRQYGFGDFAPATQDYAALALIKGRGALSDVLAGRFDRAIVKCRNEWTSLPGAMEQGYGLEKAHEILIAKGGTFADRASA